MNQIRFVSTRLAVAGKKGIITPDQDGYYDLILGGLNSFNSVGELYTYKGCEELFKDSSVFMRRVAGGTLKSELGHPKKQAGMSDREFYARIMHIEETNVCAHIREVWLDFDFGKNNPQFRNRDLIAIMGKVKPVGEKGPQLKESLENRHENLGFSVRGFTKNLTVRGQVTRVLDSIITFDQVTEQGISIAEKWSSPALESLQDWVVNMRIVSEVAESTEGLAMESSRIIAQQLVESVRSFQLPVIPVYGRW